MGIERRVANRTKFYVNGCLLNQLSVRFHIVANRYLVWQGYFRCHSKL